MLATIIAIALNGAFCLVVYLLFQARIRRALDAGEIVDRIRDEVNHMVVDLNQTTDRNVRLIEERIERLQDLLMKADKKVQLVSREYHRYEVGMDVYDKLKKAAHSAETETVEVSPSPGIEEVSLSSSVMALHRQGFDPRIIAGRLGKTLGEVELIISLNTGHGEE